METKLPAPLTSAPDLGDRRPIASRNLRVWQATAGWLARAGVSPNAISVFGMLAAFAGAGMLAGAGYAGGIGARILLAGAAGCILLRLLANMLDGMVAIAAGKASPFGELFNEIPDRLSDTAILVCAGYAPGGEPVLGWGAAAVALFVTYIRAVGKGMGVLGLFQGPMAKSHRMFTVIVTCVYLAVTPAAWQPEGAEPWGGRPVGIMAGVLALIVVGGVLTAMRRLGRLVSAIRERG